MISKDTFNNMYIGLSTDDWDNIPDVENGVAGFEMDTSKSKMYDAENSVWRYIK